MDGVSVYQPQVAFLDHVFGVVDAGTAEAIADSSFLAGFGRFSVAATVADTGTWTGRYLFGRRTYLEVFGPDDVQGADTREGDAGVALSTRERGGLGIVSDRMAALGSRAGSGRVTRQDGERQVPWFDYLEAVGTSPTFEAWVMEFLQVPSDLQRRESAFLEWVSTKPSRPRPFIDDIRLVQLAVPADQIAAVEPILRAAGFEVVAKAETFRARDTDTTVELLPTAVSPGLRRIEFTLAVPASGEHVETIGRSRISLGPGPRAVWDFSNSVSGP